ncbi:MAG: hypothetical protein JSW28_09890 [Thermoplasmata archaeon]|nr:MAG: hypothetical protein JSW28_09890 [Thermoplasmata archaeon]
MAHNRKVIIALMILLVAVMLREPVDRDVMAITVDDGTVADWTGAAVVLYDPMGDIPPGQLMTDLTFVAFDFDDTWLYVRWDIRNDSMAEDVLFDMGINLTATGDGWDIFVSAQIESIAGESVLTNISIRKIENNKDVYIWNASDDGSMSEDGNLYFDPVPGGLPGNHSTEARFPLSYIGAPTGVIFGQFRSHTNLQVTSDVKDFVPEPPQYIILSIDSRPPEFSNLTHTPDPQDMGGKVNITVDVTDDYGVNSVYVNITMPNGSWINASMPKGTDDQWFHNITYDLPGVYSYIIWANDSADNWNSTGPGTFTILDIGIPEFFNLYDYPDPQEHGGFVNITADITDDAGVVWAWVNITMPDGSWFNASMSQGTGDMWFFNSTYDELGLYSYTVWANDTHNYWNSSWPGTYTIQDTMPPQFSNLNDFPDPQEYGFSVNITVEAADDVGMGEVWINITYPNGTWTNQTMEKGTGNVHFYDTIYSNLDVHSYTVWANDTSDNWNSTGPGTFIIIETELPELSDVTDIPDPQENGGYVNITVDVTDNIDVGGVWINILYPDGSRINVSMLQGSGDEWYLSIPYDDLGDYVYLIWARDVNYNWNSTGSETFSIIDTDVPEVIDFYDTPDPQENGDYVTVTAHIVDDVGIEEVWLNITYPNSGLTNTSMDEGVIDEWLLHAQYDELGTYSYTIWAKDVADNWNSAGPGTFTIRDTEPPWFENLVDNPDPQENGGLVNITVDVKDDTSVAEVWIHLIYPGGTSTNTSMDRGEGDSWFFETPYPYLGDHYYMLWASDISGNWNGEGLESFLIRDTDSPEIGDPDATPEEQGEGEHVNITVDVTDDVGTDEVLINISLPNGAWLNVSMTQGSGNQWFFDDTFDIDGNYSYTIWAADESGNWNSSGAEAFRIIPPEEPPVEPPYEPPVLLYMTVLFIFWPLLLILFAAACLRRHGFDNRFMRDLEAVSTDLVHLFAVLNHDDIDFSSKAMQWILTISQRTGIPVEEFVLAQLADWSASGIDGMAPRVMDENIIALKNSLNGNMNHGGNR